MGKYSEMKYSDMYEVLCNELCCEMEKFEHEPDMNHLKCVKELMETIGELQEIEAGSAMREFAEDRLGYNMDDGFSGMTPHYGIPGTYNNVPIRRRGNRSRSMQDDYSGAPNTHYGFPTYGPNRGNMQPNGMPDYTNRDRMSREDGRMGYNDDEPYMLRQDNGKPRMTPYAMHTGTIPKKLTDEQYKEWMHSLVNADGSSGPHWTIEQTRQVQQKAGMTDVDSTVFWVTMNASYSDLCEFFSKHGINDPMAYAEYVDAFWLDDEDAVGNGDAKAKLAAYYMAVVEH